MPPLSQAVDKRAAVFAVMISKYSFSVRFQLWVFANSNICPSVIFVAVSVRTLNNLRCLFSVTIRKNFESKKSPVRIAASFPQIVFADGFFRRMEALSMTSSWRRLAV